ncbi:MAG: arsenosugar biosynthesis radical SAM (seleno)protein ArsS [Ginsengibacter sp.]
MPVYKDGRSFVDKTTIRKPDMKSLKARGNVLAESDYQVELLETDNHNPFRLVPFQQKLQEAHLFPLTPTNIEIFQVNVGKMCNQVCKHCHVDAGPDRKEIMTMETMELCLEVLRKNPSLKIVDLTGGAPELNPNFRWFVEQIKELDRHIIVRCNLTIILSNKRFHDLPEFFKKHSVEVVSSLPFYTKGRTDRQRGDGVFEDSILALQMLNKAGYGKDTALTLNLVYNPAGAFLPPVQDDLENEFKEALNKDFGIVFNNLFAITNLPISRFLDYLLTSGNYETYMEKLIAAYNPVAAQSVMCRNTLSIGWDGYLYDCDFNQMLDLKVSCQSKHLSDFNFSDLSKREIVINQHCYGCTAGAGSSCGGVVA